MKIWAGAAVAVIAGFATQASAQSGDSAKGQRVFNQQCRACHTLEKDGTAQGYEFSEAMKKSGIVWDDTTMADYNRDPKGKVPGTKMVFNGVKQPAQLADLVVYLKQATQ
jgi:cytochrome c